MININDVFIKSDENRSDYIKITYLIKIKIMINSVNKIKHYIVFIFIRLFDILINYINFLNTRSNIIINIQ